VQASKQAAAPRTSRSTGCWSSLAQADHRPAHLTRVHRALASLPEDEQRRPGVTADRNLPKGGAQQPACDTSVSAGHRWHPFLAP